MYATPAHPPPQPHYLPPPRKKTKKTKKSAECAEDADATCFFCFISVAAIVKGEIGFFYLFFFFFHVRECVVAQAGRRRMCREENVADCLVKARRARLCN